MKPRALRSLLPGLLATLAPLASSRAAELTWNGSPGATWDTTTVQWLSDGNPAIWASSLPDSARFTSTGAGAISVGSGITAAALSFEAPGYTLGGGTLTLGGTSPTITTQENATLTAPLAGTAGFTKTGAATLSLGGVNNYNGPTRILAGGIHFQGSASSTPTNNELIVGGSSGRAFVHFNSSGTFNYGTTAGNVRAGGNDGFAETGAGAILQSSGTVNLARNGTYLELGTNTGGEPTSYGSYLLTGGTLNITVNGGARIGNGGYGVFTQTGGTANIGRWFAIGASTGAAAFSQGVVTLTGGTLTVNSSFRTLMGDRQNASGTLNLGTQAGGSAVMTNANASGITLLATTTARSATLNLNGGTLVLGGAIQRNGTTAGSTATVNLNGGTLRPTANNLTLLSGNNGLTAHLFNGGLTVDTQAFNTTLSAPLLLTTGQGLYPAGGILERPAPSGEGYLGTPLVSVTTSGAGSGASAIANLSNGQITGVTLTCPGQNYAPGDTITFRFAGGGATTAATDFTHILSPADLAANGSGGLTKLGSGKLTLTGSNTFTGPLAITGSLSAPDLTLANTTLSLNQFSASAPIPLEATQSLTTGGTVQVQISGTFTPGSWPILFYPVGGTIQGAGISAFQLLTSTLPRGVVASLIDNVANSSVDLLITELNPLTWKGSIDNRWDLNTTANWTIGNTPETFQTNDIVLFNDSVGSGPTDVVLDAAVSPASVTFANHTKDYSLGGSGGLTGTTTLSKTGTGSLSLDGTHSHSGGTFVDAGTLVITGGSLTGPLENNANLRFQPATTATFNGLLRGNGVSLVKSGAGTMILTGENTYSGTIQVQQGTLQFGNGASNGSPGGAAYQIDAGATLRLDRATAATPAWANLSGAGLISLNSAQAINGSANWGDLALPATFTGTLRLERGRAGNVAGVAALGGTSLLQILPGAQLLNFTSAEPYTQPIEIAGNGWGETGYPGGLRLAATATATWAGPVTLTADSGIMAQRGANFTITGPITGPHTCEFYAGDPAGDSGTLTIAPASPVRNAYAATNINGRPNASVVAGNEFAFSTGPLTIEGAILRLNGHSHHFAALAGTGGRIGNFHPETPATLSIGGETDATCAAILLDGDAAPLALVKSGPARLLLSAATAYSGPTEIQAGTLALSSPTLADAAPVTLASGAVLELTHPDADTVGALILAGNPMPAGTYNSAHPTHGSFFAGPGSLVVAGSSPQGFEAWAQTEGLSGQDALPSADPDGDGVANLLEYILGGKALQPDAAAILPTQEIANGFLTLRYRRSQASLADTLQTGQWSTNLLTWTDIEPILVQNNSPEPDDMEIRVPLGNAINGKIFARLQALPTP